MIYSKNIQNEKRACWNNRIHHNIYIYIPVYIYIDQLLVLQLLILAVHMMDVDQYGREWCSTQSRWIVGGHTRIMHGGHTWLSIIIVIVIMDHQCRRNRSIFRIQ